MVIISCGMEFDTWSIVKCRESVLHSIVKLQCGGAKTLFVWNKSNYYNKCTFGIVMYDP